MNSGLRAHVWRPSAGPTGISLACLLVLPLWPLVTTAGAPPPSKAQVTVILKRMFHPDELLADASAKAELEADVLAECNKLGPVDKVGWGLGGSGADGVGSRWRRLVAGAHT